MADVVEVNCTTGEKIERDFTLVEKTQREKDLKAFEAEQAQRKAEAQAKAEAKASAEAKLASLGLTAEEIAALTK